MQQGIQVICFAVCYGVALTLELIGLQIRGATRRVALLVSIGAGLIAHSWYLGTRAVELSTWPLSNAADWCLVAAWLLAALYLIQTVFDRGTAIGLFLVPSILTLIGVGELAGQQRFSTVRASRFWGNVHGTFLLLGTVAVMVGFVAGIMYLIHSWRLKRKMLPTRGFRLPSLEWLERINSQALAVSTIFITVGFASGIVLRQIKIGTRGVDLPWSDPVVISLGAMMVWLVLAEILRASYPAARRGRKVAYLTVAAFVFLCLTFFSLFGLQTGHVAGGSRNTSAASGLAAAVADSQPRIRIPIRPPGTDRPR